MKCSVFLSSLLVCAAVHAAELPEASRISFNRDIRPILSENCYACHGFDPKHREGGLRLDTFEGATEDRDGARGIVPGDPAKSDIWQRIISTDKDEVMPPPKSHKPPLNTAQRDLLKKWIEQGARYERHWAFESPKKTASSGIDAFILARLEALKAAHSALPVPERAGRSIGIRRKA